MWGRSRASPGLGAPPSWRQFRIGAGSRHAPWRRSARCHGAPTGRRGYTLFPTIGGSRAALREHRRRAACPLRRYNVPVGGDAMMRGGVGDAGEQAPRLRASGFLPTAAAGTTAVSRRPEGALRA